MWRFIARQPIFLVAAGLLALLGVFYLSGVPSETFGPFAPSRWATPVFLLLVLLSAWNGIGRPQGLRERRFWWLFRGAFGVWAIMAWSEALVPDLFGAPSPALIAECFNLAIFLAMLLAAEEMPGSPRLAGPAAAELRLAHRFGLVSFVFAALVYFVLIPSRLNPEVYATALPSLLLYVVLDLFLAHRFFHVAQRAHPARWRRIGRLVGWTFLGWAAIDVADAGTRAGFWELGSGTPFDLFWFAPFVLLVAAFRLRGARAESDERIVSGVFLGAQAEGSPRHVRWSVVALPLLLPIAHFVGYGAGLLDPESRMAREVALVLSVLVLGGLAMLNVMLHRGARRLVRSQRLTALGQLTAGVAHDFNNLLTVIRGHGELLADELPRESGHRHQIEEMVQAAERASDLTRQLLNFAREDESEIRVIDLNALLRDLRQMLQRLLGERVSLELHLEPRLPRVHGDRGQLEQVVMNLVLNACDAMPEGGQVALVTANVESRHPSPGSPMPSGSWVRLAVEDAGHGIDGAHLERIFEPFFTTKERGRGTGLGLSTTFAIVAQNGGFLRVESRLGEGARFEVYLPPSSQRPTPMPGRSQLTPPDGLEKEKVLWVEDDPGVRLYGRRVLEREGYEVLEAEDGEAALEVLERPESERVRLLITDVVMPGISGPELAARVLAQRPNLRVLYVSGYSANELAHPLLTKPFSPGELSAKVEELLERDSSAVA